MLKTIEAGVLNVAYEESGPSDGAPVFLLHGFPYDIHAYDEVAALLAEQNCRVITPYLRGYGPTEFLSKETPRSGQQAVLAHDLLTLMDVLAIKRAVLAGYDWGGRAACIVAALWPERVNGLLTGCGYNIHDIAGSGVPMSPDDEHRLWYQYYFHNERGRAGLEKNRFELCRLLWELWSPSWQFDDATYERTAASFENADFVPVVIQSYRHRYALAPGDPTVEDTERKLAAQPPITVPAIAMYGGDDGVMRATGSEGHERFFSGRYERQLIDGAGHNLPQEVPKKFAAAVMSLV